MAYSKHKRNRPPSFKRKPFWTLYTPPISIDKYCLIMIFIKVLFWSGLIWEDEIKIISGKPLIKDSL